FISLSQNPLTNLDFIRHTPALTTLILNDVGSRSLEFPAGAPNLSEINTYNSSLTRLVLGPDVQGPVTIRANSGLAHNALIIAPEQLQALGVRVGDPPGEPGHLSFYPVVPELGLDPIAGALQILLRGYPGVYSIETSRQLEQWIPNRLVTNLTG